MNYTRTPITVKEAASMQGLAPRTVYNGKAGTHKLTRIRQGRTVRLIRQEVEVHIEQRIKASQRNN